MGIIHFLLVDDERPFIEALARRLTLRGHAVDLAFSGEEALQRLEQDSTIDVVLLDLKMPGLDGIQTVTRLKQHHPLVEVLMLTGHATIRSAIAAMQRGACDYLTKPCDLNDLLAKARSAAARKHRREEEIRLVKARPYISDRERNALIAKILND
jgi:DNA-binding NtrC family response regulator